MRPSQRPLVAYVDTTAVLPITFGEDPAGTSVQRRLDTFQHLMSSNLLEAELRAAFNLEGEDFDISSISSIRWIFPDPQLDAEMTMVLEFAYLSPIRMWHLATAMLFRAALQSDLAFITLDEQQETVARELGFWIP